MEPGRTVPEAPPCMLSPDGFDDIIALEITEVSPDLVVLQLKEDTLEGCAGEAYKDEGDVPVKIEQVPMFKWDALQREDCNTQWRAPGATPVHGLTDGQISECYGMIVNSVAEEMYTTIPEACFGNLELQFYPCDICEASFTDEQELERHVSDSHFISGAKRNERRGKASSIIRKEGTVPEEKPFSPGFSPPKMPTRKTHSTPLQCVVCGRIFRLLKSFKKHQWYHTWRQVPNNSASAEKHQPVTAGPYHHNQSAVRRRGLQHSDLLKKMSPLRCCECDRHFGTKETFYKHQCFHLRKQLRAFNASGKKSKGVNFFHCQLCALPFTGGLEFEHHIKVTHPEQYKKAAKNKCSAEKTKRKRSGALKDGGKTVSLDNSEGGFPQNTVVPEERTAITEQQDPETVQLSHPCPECGKSFMMKAMLNMHQKMYHNKADARRHNGNQSHACHKCTKCEKTFRTRRMLQKHKQMHHKKKALKCCECRRHFGAAEAFYKHQCFHLRKQLRAFNASGRKSKGVNFFHCQLCTLQFTEGLAFERHIKFTHPEQYKKATKNKCSAGKPTKTLEPIVENNVKTFAKPSSVAKVHVKMTRVEPKVEDEGAPIGDTSGSCSASANIEEQGAGTSGPLYQCSMCGRIFKVRKMLDKHQRIYHRDQSTAHHRGRRHPAMTPLRCCECDRHFGTKDTFYRHQCFHLRKQLRAFNASGRKSKGVNFFHCQLCALPFTGGLEFEHHIKVTHPEQYKKAAKNKCSTEKTRTKRFGALKDTGKTVSLENSEGGFPSHVVVPEERTAITERQDSETVQLSHPCPECGKSFMIQSMLNRHQIKYHNTANTRLHKRNQSHACHKCTKCEKTFRIRRMLRKHKQMHHKKKALKCCECRRHFGAAEAFYKHQCFHLRKQLRAFIASGRKSKGENFFHCQLCTLQFTEGLEFERHIKVTHREQYKKATKNKCSARKNAKTQETGVVNNGKTFRKLSSVTKVHVKMTKVEPKVENQDAPISDTSGSCSVAANVEEQGSGTSGPLHQCLICGRIFKVRKMLDKHQRIYHRDQSVALLRGRGQPAMTPLRCCECDRHFGTKETFYKHQCFHLRKQLRAFNASGKKSKGVNFFHCQLCALPFTGGLELEHHIKITHPEQYKKAAKNKCSAEKTKRKRSGALKDGGKTVSLDNSEGGFPQNTVVPEERTAITKQQDSETVQLSHPCPECGKSFMIQVMLNRHQKRYHNKADTRLQAAESL